MAEILQDSRSVFACAAEEVMVSLMNGKYVTTLPDSDWPGLQTQVQNLFERSGLSMEELREKSPIAHTLLTNEDPLLARAQAEMVAYEAEEPERQARAQAQAELASFNRLMGRLLEN